MNANDRAFALFTACEAARSAVYDAAREAGNPVGRVSAHAAALAVWDEWAGPLIDERMRIEDAGDWATEFGFDSDLVMKTDVGQNDRTREFLRRANINAASLAFVLRDYKGEDNGNGEENDPESKAEDAVRTIECECISLTGYRFPGNAYFNSTTFKGDASIKGNVWFDNATFEVGAWFNSTTFEGNAYFGSATFEGNVYFGCAIFKGDARFYDATFEDTTLFNSVTFKGNAWFSKATFEDDARFNGATFEDAVSFGQVNFDSHADFSGARFFAASDFTALHSTRAFNMAGVLCQVPQFTQAHFTESPRLDHLHLPEVGPISGRLPFPDGVKRGKKVDQNDIAAFTALRRLAIKGEDSETERTAFKGEMRSRRVLLCWWSPKWLSYAYDGLTDFGMSIVRPSVLWLLLLVGMAGYYLDRTDKPVSEWFSLSQVERDCGRPVYPAILLSLRNGLLFATAGQKLHLDKANACLYGSNKGNAGLGLVGTGHTVFSALMIFFILLALRNRFKIK